MIERKATWLAVAWAAMLASCVGVFVGDGARGSHAPTRVPRRVDRDGRQHRLALEEGALDRAAESGTDRDSRQVGRPKPQRGDPADSSLGRRPLRVADRALVGIPHRHDGAAPQALLRSAEVRGRRGSQAGAATPRLAQSVPRPPQRRQDAPLAGPCQQRLPRDRPRVRRLPLVRSGRARVARSGSSTS